ncbi:hypothetical protein ACFE04_002337 [Oxalis oulophora]
MDSPGDRIASTGERPVKPNISTEQPISPKDERVVSANPYPDAAITGPSSSRAPQQKDSSSTTGLDIIIPPQFNSHDPNQQNTYYGGYGNNTATWDGYSQNMNVDGFNMTPVRTILPVLGSIWQFADFYHLAVMYGDNPSLMFPSGYGFSPEMPYGQYSPFASPFSPVMVDGQLYSPQFSPTFYPQPNMPGGFPIAQSELMTAESGSDGLLFSPGHGYVMPFGSYGGGNVSGNPSSGSLPSPVAYPQQMSILGSYEQSIGQRPPMQGYGLPLSSSNSRYLLGGSYQSSNFGSGLNPYSGANDRNRFGFDKGRRRERDSDVISISSYSYGADSNRGPRALKSKGKSITDLSSSSANSKNDLAASETQLSLYSGKDFVTDYDNAKFFIIKSFSEDNVHRSIKYNVWASTPNGNKKLDAAYNEAKDMKDKCPVNASGQFCGVAEMVGPVDFEKNADYWQQDRWSGQFAVQWHIIKDVPNSRFRHIILENNDNKPVTHSRDSQEVKQEHGIEMLKIFKDHEARTSILDDFDFYNERENLLKEMKTKPLTNSTDQVSEGNKEKLPSDAGSYSELEKKEKAPSDAGSCSGLEISVSVADDGIHQISEKFSESLLIEGNGDKEVSATAVISTNEAQE